MRGAVSVGGATVKSQRSARFLTAVFRSYPRHQGTLTRACKAIPTTVEMHPRNKPLNPTP